MARSSGGKKNQDNTAKTTSQTTSLDQLTDQVLEATTDIKPAEVNLSVEDNPLLKRYNFYNVKTEKVAEEYQEEQNRRKATEHLIANYDPKVEIYRGISDTFNNTYGKYLQEKFDKKFWQLRKDFTDKSETLGTRIDYHLDPKRQKDNTKNYVPLNQFAKDSGIIFKVLGKDVFIFKEFQNQYDENTGKIKRVKLHNHDNPVNLLKELKESGRITRIQDPVSQFTIVYCVDQFNVRCNEMNQDKESEEIKGKSESLVKMASYIAIEPNENYYDMELNDNGNPSRLSKFYGITTAYFDHGIDLYSVRENTIYIDKLMEAFNDFFVKELESIGLSDLDKVNYYEIYKESRFSLYETYLSYLNITIGSKIPYSSQISPFVRETLIQNDNVMSEGKMAMLHELKKPKIIKLILDNPKIKIPPKLTKLFTETKENIQSQFENPEEVLNEYSKYKIVKELIRRNSLTKNISSQEQKHLSNLHVWIKEFEPKNEEMIKFLEQIDSELSDGLIEFGKELQEARKEKFRLKNKERLENETSYDEGKRGGATIDPEPDSEEEAILSDFSEVMRDLDKEYPLELEHLREIPNKNLGEDEDDIDQ